MTLIIGTLRRILSTENKTLVKLAPGVKNTTSTAYTLLWQPFITALGISEILPYIKRSIFVLLLVSASLSHANGLSSAQHGCDKAGIIMKGNIAPGQRIKCVVAPIKMHHECEGSPSFGLYLSASENAKDYLRIDVIDIESGYQSRHIEYEHPSITSASEFNFFELGLLPLIVFGAENNSGILSYFTGVAEDTSKAAVKAYHGKIEVNHYSIYLKAAKIN